MNRPSFAIYDASAGSGKTYNLVKEYLKIILKANTNDAYKSILAITFTNKAVHEMKNRIVSNLTAFASDNPSQKVIDFMMHIASETNLTPEQIKEKAKKIIKNLIHNYAAFDISTIDKFTHKVIRTFAHDLNLPINFEVAIDSKSLLKEAVDAIISYAGQDESLTKLLVDFTLEKTDNDKSWDITKEILATAELVLNENNRNEILSLKDKTIPDFIEVKKRVGLLADEFKIKKQHLASEALNLIDSNNIQRKSFSAEAVPKYLENVKKDTLKPSQKVYYKPEDVKINKTASDKGAIEGILPELLNFLQQIFEINEKLHLYQSIYKNVTPLSLLNTVNIELAKIQEEQNLLSISEFNAIIHNEIQNQPAPFIYERLGERYRHFFIDEFQDTSQMQWENMIPLIENSLSGQSDSGDKGTLMIVGDAKQSIYRWRGGKAEQFIALSHNKTPFVNVKAEIVTLETNYRSFSEVIEFNNAFFKFISNTFENEDYRNLYANNSSQNINSKKGGYVNCTFLPANFKEEADENIEEETTAADLYCLKTFQVIQKVLDQGFDLRDIAILTRKTSDGVLIANYLTEQNIPILSSETLLIKNAAEVGMIIHVLHYLNNSKNQESKAYFLYFLANKHKEILNISDFISEGMSFENEVDIEKWLVQFEIQFSFSAVRKKSLYEAVELIILNFIKPDFNNAYIQFFADIVLEYDIRKQGTVRDFLEYWENNNHKFSIPLPEGNNAVRIMTIHKSKGLEFPVVILPFANYSFDKNNEKLWVSNQMEEIGMNKVLIDSPGSGKSLGQEVDELSVSKKQELLLDNFNISYVAFTRAEEQLYIISQIVNPSKTKGDWPNNQASYIIQFLQNIGVYEENKLEYEFGDFLRISEKHKSESRVAIIPAIKSSLPIDAVKIAQKEALMWGTHQQEAINYGNVIHEILSWIITRNDCQPAIKKALENGLITEEQKSMVTETIRIVMEHPEISNCFDEGKRVFNEKNIIQPNGAILKPDRIVINDNNQVILLDYKTGVHDLKYKKQLERYQLVLEAMNLYVVKKALVYINEEVSVEII